MNPMQYDVIVIGAGIVGVACALEAVTSGQTVAIVEAEVVGAGATAAGMGHLVVMDDSPAQLALTQYSIALWHQLAAKLPAAAEYSPCGTIWVAADAEEMAEVERKAGVLAERDIAAQILDAAALAQAEPNLRSGLVGGLHVPGDSVIYPPRAALYLVEEACAQGAALLVGQAVTHIEDGTVRLADGRTLTASAIVLAAGSGSLTLLPTLSIQLRKGHLAITNRYPGFAAHQLVELGYLKRAHALTEDSVAFNVQPRPTGQVLIGSSRQFGRTSSQVDKDILSQMLARAVEYMPALIDLQIIRVWTGFRAATPDNLPLIGLCPGYDHVYLATGHEGLGITTSLATARLVVDQWLDRPSAIPADPYLPTRVTDWSAHA